MENIEGSTSSICPFCHKGFPSSTKYCNMGPLDHKRMILRHITNCSMLPLSSYHPNIKTKDCRASNNTAASTCPIPGTTSPSVKITVVDSVTLQHIDDQQYSIVSNDSEDQHMANLSITRTDEVVAAEDIDNITSKLVTVGYSKKGSYGGAYSSSGLPLSEEIFLPPLHCPICLSHFPREHNVDAQHHEQLVIQHVLECSRQITDHDIVNYSGKITKKKLKQKVPEKGGRSKDKQKSLPSRREKSSKKKVKRKEEAHIISDPQHLLAQTWWRKPAKAKRKNGTENATKHLPVMEFSLQQCVVSKEDEYLPDEEQENDKKMGVKDVSNSGIRGSKRVKDTALDLRCPICRKKFLSYRDMGSCTEESMSRHVQKCSKKVFETRVHLGGQNKTKAMKIICPEEKSSGKINVLFCEEEKKQYRHAMDYRKCSIAAILHTEEEQKQKDGRKMAPLDLAFCSLGKSHILAHKQL
mmetsp:Transcript_3680/g.5617  ORF Transcript_3680/g.5617 Transcript_3680/m.5617 type:complete len:468 (-) Transcript_3680:146-1549(-)